MLSPLHPALRPRRYLRKIRADRATRGGVVARTGRILLTLLLNYKIVLAAVWVVGVGFWLILQILPARPESRGQGEASLTAIDEPTPTPTLVSDTSSAADELKQTRDEY